MVKTIRRWQNVNSVINARHLFKVGKPVWCSYNVGEDGKIFLSGRTIIELDQYLQEVYPESVNKCFMCTKICLMAETCDNCGIKLHFRCAKNFFQSSTEEKHCPAMECNAPWGQISL